MPIIKLRAVPEYHCPVCAYAAMRRPPANFAICECCGTQFGYDDVGHTYDELRREWSDAGAPWFSRATQPPQDWNGYRQLLRNGLALRSMSQAEDTENIASFAAIGVRLHALNSWCLRPAKKSSSRRTRTTRR